MMVMLREHERMHSFEDRKLRIIGRLHVELNSVSRARSELFI